MAKKINFMVEEEGVRYSGRLPMAVSDQLEISTMFEEFIMCIATDSDGKPIYETPPLSITKIKTSIYKKIKEYCTIQKGKENIHLLDGASKDPESDDLKLSQIDRLLVLYNKELIAPLV